MMDTQRRLRLREIFDTLSDQSPETRTVHLDAACGSDVQMRRELETLLKASDSAGGFFSSPETHIRGRVDDSDETGGRAGRYELVEKLGEGGFGIVYLAEQRHPLRRQVAVKIIKPGMDSRQVIARFEAERQALALMDHPNIARVHDAGTDHAGRPYFVMELVRGRPVTTYCDDNRLTVRERLGLFVDICRAVQHAHQKGIIHRDLKPSNVLVTERDGMPVPKVIDFGVAKAVSGRLTDVTIATECRQFIGTPEYMSPEQADTVAADVDTRADVY